MTATNPNNETLADAVALIAVCKGSVALMEVALALQMVASGVVEVPEEARKNRTFARVHRRLTSPAWIAAARAALGHEGLARVAACFRAGCFEYATPKTAAFYDDEEWLRGIQLYYLFEENMRVLADMILELMRLPEVDVEPRQAPAARPKPVAPPPPATPPQPALPPAMDVPSAEWAIPIALIAIGKAERNPLWVSFGATVGCLSGLWGHEPKLAEDPQFAAAAKKMVATPRGFEMASALLHDPALRAASQAMMMRWYAVTGGNVSSDSLRAVRAVDAELAVLVSAVLRATSAVMMTFVTPTAAPSTNDASLSPSTSSSWPTVEWVNLNIQPPALPFVPARSTPVYAGYAFGHSQQIHCRADIAAVLRPPRRPSHRSTPLPRGRSPPAREVPFLVGLGRLPSRSRTMSEPHELAGKARHAP